MTIKTSSLLSLSALLGANEIVMVLHSPLRGKKEKFYA